MSGPTVYTPATLATRWECSERHIRNLIESGALPAFRLGGKLLRIRREDVEAFECGGSLDCAENGVSHGQMQTESADVIALGQMTGKRRSAAPRLDLRSSRAREGQR